MMFAIKMLQSGICSTLYVPQIEFLQCKYGRIVLSSLICAQCRKQHFKMYNSFSGLTCFTYVYVVFAWCVHNAAHFVHNSISGLTPFTYFRFIVSLDAMVGVLFCVRFRNVVLIFRLGRLHFSKIFAVHASSLCPCTCTLTL